LPLSITTHSAIGAQTAFCFDFSHASLVETGQGLANGAGLRLQHWDGNTWNSVAWVLDPESAWDQADTRLCFRPSQSLPEDSTNHEYFLYFSATEDSVLRHRYDSVFWSGNDFERSDEELMVNLNLSGNYSSSVTAGALRIIASSATTSGCGIASASTPTETQRFLVRSQLSLLSVKRNPSEIKSLSFSQGHSAPACSSDAWLRLSSVLDNNRYRLIRRNPLAQLEGFNAQDEAWTSLESASQQSYNLGTKLRTRLEALPDTVRITIARADGSQTLQSDWMPRTELSDTSEPYWVVWGETSTTDYAADFAIDWFTIELEVEQAPDIVDGPVSSL
jgi:hypothetical protein